MNIENIKNTLNILCSSLDLDNEQRFYFLSKYLESNAISKEDLRNGFISLFTNEDYNLFQIIKENDELIENVDLYTKIELVNYVKEWLWDFLYPNRIMIKVEIEILADEVKKILQNYNANIGWMYSYDLYEKLKEQERFKNLEYYNLWKIPFQKLNIERKPIEGKDREIGYLRYGKI